MLQIQLMILQVSVLSQTHSLMFTVIAKESKLASSSEGPGGSAVLHPRPLSKQACMCNSCVQGKQTDMSQCLHTHLCPYSHRNVHSSKSHNWRQVFLSGLGSCQALLTRACIKDSLRHRAHASSRSTCLALRCTPDLLLFRCRKEWMLPCYLSVSKERCCHRIACVGRDVPMWRKRG